MVEKKFYSINEAAEVLGVTPAEVNQMRERNQLQGYRDGADWKFKADQVQQKLAEQIRQQGAGEDSEGSDESGDVLLSERELGASGPGSSGTVIEPAMGGPADSDIQLATGRAEGDSADSDIDLAGSDVDLAGGDEPPEADSKSVDEMDLTLDEDLALEDSEVAVGEEPQPAGGSDAGSIDLTSEEALDDDDLVLGGSGSGSDITIGGDSGISLVDPADSGLSLEDPLDLGAGEESLELGEDDMLTLTEGQQAESPADLDVDSDFELTPLEGADEEDSESGSQVIALEPEGEESATLVAGPGEAAIPAMLEEDLTPTGDLGLGVPASAAPMVAEPVGMVEPGFVPEPAGEMVSAAAMALPETPFTLLQVLSLAGCVVLLAIIGMMCYDLLQNIWSWDAPYSINSWLMDLFVK